MASNRSTAFVTSSEDAAGDSASDASDDAEEAFSEPVSTGIRMNEHPGEGLTFSFDHARPQARSLGYGLAVAATLLVLTVGFLLFTVFSAVSAGRAAGALAAVVGGVGLLFLLVAGKILRMAWTTLTHASTIQVANGQIEVQKGPFFLDPAPTRISCEEVVDAEVNRTVGGGKSLYTLSLVTQGADPSIPVAGGLAHEAEAEWMADRIREAAERDTADDAAEDDAAEDDWAANDSVSEASAADASLASASAAEGRTLDRLREGDRVAYDGRVWTVTEYTPYTHEAWPAATWTLTAEEGTGTLLLEHDFRHRDVFRATQPIDMADVRVDGTPVDAVHDTTPPARVEHAGTDLVLAERDARLEEREVPSVPYDSTGTKDVQRGSGDAAENEDGGLYQGGLYQVLSEYLNVGATALKVLFKYSSTFGFYVFGGLFLILVNSPAWEWSVIPGILALSGGAFHRILGHLLPAHVPEPMASSSHHWRYEGDGRVVILERRLTDDGSAFAGREVAPHEIEVLAPGPSAPERGTISELLASLFGSGPVRPPRKRPYALGSAFCQDDPPRRSATDLSPDQLRTGDLVDLDMRTWTVTDHASVPYAGWPTAEWTLEDGDALRFLEHDAPDGDEFHLSAPADLTEITVEGAPFLSALPEDGTAPTAVTYRGTTYTLAEEDARPVDRPVREDCPTDGLTRSRTSRTLMGLFGGIAEYMGIDLSTSVAKSALFRTAAAVVHQQTLAMVLFGIFFFGALALSLLEWGPMDMEGVLDGAVIVSIPLAFLLSLVLALPVYIVLALRLSREPPPREERLSHHWRYEADDKVVLLDRYGANAWLARAGRRVEPYAFDNILPDEAA